MKSMIIFRCLDSDVYIVDRESLWYTLHMLFVAK